MTWSVANELHKIKVPTLLINGVDEGADDESLEMFQTGVADAKWVKFEDSRHMPHWEERERYMQVVGDFFKA
jgi:L-proline amide hydrolase